MIYLIKIFQGLFIKIKNLLEISILIGIACFTTWLIQRRNYVHEESYMDEIFHVPQMQAYCENNFSHWDPKITTFPGLYIGSYGLIKFVRLFYSSTECNSSTLRYLNVIFISISYLYLVKLLKRYMKKFSMSISLYSLIIIFNPFFYFFTIFYYTEAFSLMTVLIYLNFTLDKNVKSKQVVLSFLLGLVMILARQTNVAWILFILGYRFIFNLNKKIEMNLVIDRKSVSFFEKDINSFLNLVIFETRPVLKSVVNTLLASPDIVFLLIGFVGFMLVNNGLVLGDREAHHSSLHLVQIFYFVLTWCLFSPMRVLKQVRQFIKYTSSHIFTTILGIYFFGLIIHKFTIIHPYLLAENTVIRFYILRKLNQSYIKYLMAPVYWFASFCFWKSMDSLSDCHGVLFKFNFLFCLALSVVPAPMFEFRYFVIPLVILKICFVQDFRRNNVWWFLNLVIELMICAVGNAAIMYLFFHRPFYWPKGSDQLKRFMW